jgi:hypothetical protein
MGLMFSLLMGLMFSLALDRKATYLRVVDGVVRDLHAGAGGDVHRGAFRAFDLSTPNTPSVSY